MTARRGFVKLARELLARRDLTASDKLTLAYLDDRIGANGICWPGVRRIAKDLGVHVETACHAIARLVKLGHVEIEHRGTGRVNHYRLKRSGNPYSGRSEKPDGLRAAGDGEALGKAERSARKSRALALGKAERNRPILDPLGDQPLRDASASLPSPDGDGEITKRSKRRKGKTKPKAPAKPRPRNPHADAFKAAFDATFPEPYEWHDADFVHLTKFLRKYPAVTPEMLADVAKRAWALGEYGPARALTIRGLCSDWPSVCARLAQQGIASDGGLSGGGLDAYHARQLAAEAAEGRA